MNITGSVPQLYYVSNPLMNSSWKLILILSTSLRCAWTPGHEEMRGRILRMRTYLIMAYPPAFVKRK
jgi:hypothetical protein